MEEMADAIARVRGLSLHFTLHVTTSARGRDVLDVHVEDGLPPTADQQSDADPPLDGPTTDGADTDVHTDPRVALLVAAMAACTTLVWDEACGAMEHPVVTIVPLGRLPRNARTNKIPLVVDHRSNSK